MPTNQQGSGNKTVSISEVVKTVNYTVSNDVKTWHDGLHQNSLAKGGSFGILPMIGGVDGSKRIHEWMYNHSYKRKSLIPIVLETPKIFDLMGEQGKEIKKAIKAMWEVHAKSIEGFDASLTVESNEKSIGLSGGTMKEPINVTSANVSVTLTIPERYGLPVEIIHDIWIRYGIMDPELEAPLITNLLGDGSKNSLAAQVKSYGPEYWTMTALFIEPDILLRRPRHAWLVMNMYPEGLPEITGSKKEKGGGLEVVERSISYGGFALPPRNRRVMELAQKVLDKLKLYERNPDNIILPVSETSLDDALEASLKDSNDPIYYQSTGETTYSDKKEK